MKNFKKIIIAVAVIGVLGTATIAYAATTKTPAEIVSNLTGKTIDELYKEHAAGKTYGTIANEAGKLDEFKAQMLDQKKAILDERVKNGTLTQEQEDQILSAIKSNQATCDGTGLNRGAGFGYNMGKGNGQGLRNGNGRGFQMRQFKNQ